MVRMTPDEHAALRKLAHQRSIDSGVTVSMNSLLREWIREHVEDGSGD
jgi:hypothetical protein